MARPPPQLQPDVVSEGRGLTRSPKPTEPLVERVEALRQRIADAADRRLRAAPPDPLQKVTTLRHRAAAALAEVIAPHEDREEDPHPAHAAARSLAEQTLERQGNPLFVVPPPKLADLLAARCHLVEVPNPDLATARSLAEKEQAAREQLEALKKQRSDLQSELQQVLSIKLQKESEHRCITESISCTSATNEKLKRSYMELCNKRDIFAGLSDRHQDFDVQEAKINEAATKLGNFEELFSTFHKFLGLQIVIGEEGLKFVFDKIHPQCPEKEYSVCLKIDDRIYNLVQCDPPIEDIEELVKDLNLSADLLKFLKVARERFHASSTNANDVPSVPPPVTTTDDRSSEDVPNQSNSQSKNKSLPAKRRSMILSPSSERRRSPRFRPTGSDP